MIALLSTPIPQGNPSVVGMRAILNDVGAFPGGPCHLLLLDLREESILYVNGKPYIQRSSEAPTSSWHHAGVKGGHLEGLEKLLKSDA